jgi:hypothetical protein
MFMLSRFLFSQVAADEKYGGCTMGILRPQYAWTYDIASPARGLALEVLARAGIDPDGIAATA